MIKQRKKLQTFDKNTINICSFLMLPLCGVNVLSFGGYSNFNNSYLADKDGNKLLPLEDQQYYMFVDIYDRDEITRGRKNYITWSNFVLDYDKFNNEGNYLYTRLLFRVPKVYNHDCFMFSLGKYRKMDETTKSIIYEDSGLYYKVPTMIQGGDGKPTKAYLTNHLLLAIAGSEQMKARLEANLGLVRYEDKIDPEAELWSLPSSEEFEQIHSHNTELV